MTEVSVPLSLGGQLPERPAWNEKLLSRERAYRLAGEWPLKISTHRSESGLELRLNCTACKLSCGTIQYRNLELDDLVSMVIRHRVMHHQLVLSGASKQRCAHNIEIPRCWKCYPDPEPWPCDGIDCDHPSHGAANGRGTQVAEADVRDSLADPWCVPDPARG
jgi:hypothetical protein